VLNGIRFISEPFTYVRGLHRRYGSIASVRLPNVGRTIWIADPEVANHVLSADPHVYRAGEANATVMEPVMGSNALATLDGDSHLRRRKLLVASFHGESLKRWSETIRDLTERDMQAWPTGKPFSLRPHTQRIALDVILRVVLGPHDEERLRCARARIEELATCAHAVSVIPMARRDPRSRSPWGRFKRARAALDAFLYDEIARRRRKSEAVQDSDVLSLLVRAADDSGRRMTDVELRDEAVSLIGAGYETTGTALAWAFERLLRNPRVMNRLSLSLSEGDEYLDATIREILRVRPPLLAVRRLSSDSELAGYRLPAGSMVIPAIAAIHLLGEAYDDAQEFRPERFLDGRRYGNAWIPFGGGVRRCIGAALAQLEMRVMIRTILERAELRRVAFAPEPARIHVSVAVPANGCRVVQITARARPCRSSAGRA
jgi:cytochrome P450 family 135